MLRVLQVLSASHFSFSSFLFSFLLPLIFLPFNLSSSSSLFLLFTLSFSLLLTLPTLLFIPASPFPYFSLHFSFFNVTKNLEAILSHAGQCFNACMLCSSGSTVLRVFSGHPIRIFRLKDHVIP